MQRFACNALKRIGALSEKRFFSTSCVRSRRLLPSCSTQFARPLGQWNRHSPFSVIKRFEGSVPVPEENPDSKEDARSREVLPSIPGSKTTDDVMIIVFTCKVCNTRSARKMSKEAYNHGVVLIRCPGCNNLHLIADHLGYFDDNSTNVEQILAQKGEKVTRMDDKQVLEFLHKEDLK